MFLLLAFCGSQISTNVHLNRGRFKDLTKVNFYRAWDEFKDKSFAAEFTASELNLTTSQW